MVTAAERVSDFNLTTDTPHLALKGELWGVYCEEFEENWPCYKGTTLYTIDHCNITVWILAGNYISFTIAAGLIRLHMPGVKKSRV